MQHTLLCTRIDANVEREGNIQRVSKREREREMQCVWLAAFSLCVCAQITRYSKLNQINEQLFQSLHRLLLGS